MMISNQEILLNIVVRLVFIAGIVLLQIFLSKRQNRWTGLILPGICFIYSLMAVLGYSAFVDQSTRDLAFQVFSIFLTCNIPTAVLLGIYFACKVKQKKDAEIDKMKIQDLE